MVRVPEKLCVFQYHLLKIIGIRENQGSGQTTQNLCKFVMIKNSNSTRGDDMPLTGRELAKPGGYQGGH